MNWIPVAFLITIKVLAVGIAMFFSIKSHYDGEKKEKEAEKRAALNKP